MEIKTDRLLIVPCTSESYHAFSDTYKMGPHIDMHLDELKKDSDSIGWGVWFITHCDSGLVIGDAGFKGKPNQQKTVEIGYGIQSDFQNKGYATEAVHGLKEWALTSGQVAKVVAECAEENAASIRVLEKTGMRQTSAKDGFIYWEND